MPDDTSAAPDVAPVVVAIDGPAGSGKSTVGRLLAARLGLEYLDTGAMYRGVTFAALRGNVDPDDAELVARVARHVELDLADGRLLVDGVDATIEIRGPEVTRAVSVVAANPEVRTELRRRQREWAETRRGGVLEGRDIGSVVFPDAALKVYLTASPEVRADRRSREVTDLDYQTVAADLARRDAADAARHHSPMAAADDAVLVDTTDRDVEEIVAHLLARLDVARHPAAEAEPTDAEPTDGDPDAKPAPEGVAGDPTRGPTRLERAMYGFTSTVLRGACQLWFGAAARGTEHVPAEGPFILAPVHRSNLDFALVLVTTKRRLRYLAKDSLWKGQGFWAKVFTALGGIPVARGTADREALRTCIEVVAAGEALVMFPEGTRQHGPEVQHCYDGPAFVQSRTGAPIVPVGIGGSEAAMPRGAKIPKHRKVALVVGPVLEAPEVDGGRARRSAIRARTAQLYDVIQDLFDQAQSEAGTPNR